MADNGTLGGVSTANTALGASRLVLYWLSRLHPSCRYQPYSTLYCAITIIYILEDRALLVVIFCTLIPLFFVSLNSVLAQQLSIVFLQAKNNNKWNM